MPEQELDLIQLAAGQMEEPRASAPKIVRGEFLNACTRRAPADDLPQDLRSHHVAPDFASLVERSKERAFGDAARFVATGREVASLPTRQSI